PGGTLVLTGIVQCRRRYDFRLDDAVMRRFALPLIMLATAACSSASVDDGAESADSNLDFFAASAREYWVSGKSTVTLEPELRDASEDAKTKRAKELVTLKNVAVDWFLDTYLRNKENEDANHAYGGFGALTKFASE